MKQVSIDFERDGRRRVSEAPADLHHVNAGVDKMRRVGMTERVEGNRQAYAARDVGPILRERAGRLGEIRRALGKRRASSGSLPSPIAIRSSSWRLRTSRSALNDYVGQAHVADAVLRFWRLKAKTVRLSLLDRLADLNSRRIEVHPAPAQREQLAPPHAREKRCNGLRIHGAAAKLFDQAFDLVTIECGHLVAFQLRRRFQGRGIARHQVVPQSLLESLG